MFAKQQYLCQKNKKYINKLTIVNYMKETQPYEIEMWHIVPALRRELVKVMIEKHKMSQKDCAEKLRVTEAAVSQYKKSKRAKEIKFPQSLTKEIEKSAEMIIKDKKNNCPEIRRLMGLKDMKKIVCGIHKKTGMVPKKCCVCLK